MAVNLAKVRAEYVAGAQAAAQATLLLAARLDQLADLHQGAGLAGTFADAELAADVTAQHLAPADVAAVTTDLAALRLAMTDPIRRRLAKFVGRPV
jgi:hypothetical protein